MAVAYVILDTFGTLLLLCASVTGETASFLPQMELASIVHQLQELSYRHLELYVDAQSALSST